MDAATFAASIDHTVLGPLTTPADVERVVGEATAYGMNACVPPCYLDCGRAADVTLATVVGFPHGQHAPETKREEAVRAWNEGADELDVVVSLGRLRAGDEDAVTAELADVVAAVPLPVKAIIEAPLLSDDEKRRACACAVDADADFVKTATGFSGSGASETHRANGDAVSGGATVADVELMSEYLPVKASGGIGTTEKALAMVDAGADRIGTSSGVALVEGFDDARE